MSARKPSWLEQLGAPATAGGISVIFSHPLELVKVRLQLDNERASRGTPRLYRGWIDCLRQNWGTCGIRGLQQGLSVGIAREMCFNAIRIGLFEPVLEGTHAAAHALGLSRSTEGARGAGGAERTVAGLTCGALGGCLVNPIEVLKTRMQAFGGLTGFQHAECACGPLSALAELVRTEGIGGLFSGISVSTLRGVLGPGSQLVAYNELKRTLAHHQMAPADAASTHVLCALASAVVSVACVNPVDVLRTRIYNAPPGRYASALEAGRLALETEGTAAFYKGAMAHYLRLGPHMVLVFGILEQIKIFTKGRGANS